MCLDLLLLVVLRNRDRIGLLWPAALEHLQVRRGTATAAHKLLTCGLVWRGLQRMQPLAVSAVAACLQRRSTCQLG